MTENDGDPTRSALKVAYHRAELTVEELWRRYFALGGEAGPTELEAYLQGLMPLSEMQRDLLAHAVNERLDDLIQRSRVAYSFTPAEVSPQEGALGALVRLLNGMLLASPERLRQIASAAGAALGVGLEIYLVDYEQEFLTPVPGQHGDGAPLPVDSTLAGQAFRSVRVLPGAAVAGPDLWLPLLDSAERLGVLHASLAREADVDDRTLQEQLRWVSMLIGHLIIATSAYGDKLDAVRRTRRRSIASELSWGLLPPLTAGNDSVVVSGLVQPVYDVGGDSFDYSISEDTVHLAIFDANGHDLHAGVTVATAVAAYRSARRNGDGLQRQIAAIDEVIAEHSASGENFVTGVLAEIDVRTGHLRYVVAGHPPPLLLRDGRTVKRLDHGHRGLLGLVETQFSVGEESLQAGDCLLLYTDGIPEARNPEGLVFGEDRLIDFLRREALAEEPPPETVRRLSKAIMRHQDGHLQDDATVVLARWDPGRARRSARM